MSEVTRRRVLVMMGMAAAAGCSDKPTAPSATLQTKASPTSSTMSALTIVGPDSVAPGAAGQCRATLRFEDGKTEDVTAAAAWASSRAQVLEIGPDGRAQGRERGTATITATFSTFEQRMTVRVLEPGTFVVDGKIVEASDGRTIAAATVTVDSGVGLGRTTQTDDQGAFEFYGLSGAVQLTISASGFQTRSVGLSVTRDMTAHVLLSAVRGTLKDAFKLSVIGADRVALGASSQYRAILHFMDGSTDDVTSQATWKAENVFGPPTMTIGADGMAAGIADGPCLVRAFLERFEASKTVSVLRTGTFLLAGAVYGSDAGFLHMATVTVESGIGAGKVAYNSEWDQGYYLWGVGGPVRLRASFPGYQDSTVELNVTQDTTHQFTLSR